MTDVQPLQMTLREVAVALRSGQLSPVELTELSLARINDDESTINAYTRVLAESALQAARRAESAIAAGHWRGEMHGVPVAVKDVFDMAGYPTSCSSRVRHDHMADHDSACVERLLRAGAIIVGKTQTHEFANGITTPTTGNPWNPACIPGGSSGGSAATVAARGCFMALGTDTSGSIRIPAALCGAVGIKPTYGRVSRYGAVPLSWSLDHAGPLTRTVADAAVALNVLAGHDPRDPGSAAEQVPDYLGELDQGVRGLRLGVLPDRFLAPLAADVRRCVHAAVVQLQSDGAALVEVDVPLVAETAAVEYALLLPEASSFHLDTMRERRALYGEDVLAYFEIGCLIPAVDYVAAQRMRARIQAAWRDVFRDLKLDAVIGPTVPSTAVRRGAATVDWSANEREPITEAFTRFARIANVTGLPAVSVPCGFGDAGLPVGLQIMGRPFQETRVLRIAHAYETSTAWSRMAPRVGTPRSICGTLS